MKNLSTISLAWRPVSGHTFWIMLRQISPPIECATSQILFRASLIQDEIDKPQQALRRSREIVRDG